MIAWVNLHGSFVLGAVLISVVLVDQLVGFVLRHRLGETTGDQATQETPVASPRPLLISGCLNRRGRLR